MPTTDPDIARSDSEEYICPPLMRIPIGGEVELLYLPLTKAAKIVSASDAKLLACCGRFATIGGHAERISSLSPPGAADACALRELLAGFAADGMMLSISDLLTRISGLPRPEPSPPICWLVIPSCDRPEHLRRAIRSYGANFRKWDRFPKLLIADDSKAPDACASARAVVAEEAEKWGNVVMYSGPEEKRRLIERFVQKGDFPRDVLEFGLLGPGGSNQGPGANRNVTMLQTAGELVLSADDDTICEPYVAPALDRDVLRLGADIDPSEYWFFPDRQSGLRFVRRAEVDVLSEHERLLGRPLHSLVESTAANGDVDMGSACSHILRSLWEARGAILITLNGAVGDSGMYSGRHFPVTATAGTRTRLLASREAYHAALRSREILRQVPSTTVCHGSAFMSMFFGIDNRAWLPPFFPVGHCDDGVFAFMAQQCFDGCYFGYLPWALMHDPVPGRMYFGRSATTVRISDLVVACASTWSDPGREALGACRIESLGRHLRMVASFAPDEFDEYVRVLLCKRAAQRVSFTDALLRQHREEPDFWVSDLHQERADKLAALVEAGYSTPVDVTGCNSPLRAAQRLLLRYGQFLTYWPSMKTLMKDVFPPS